MNIHHYHHFDCDIQSSEIKQRLGELLIIARQNQTILKEIKVTDIEVSTLLDTLNTTTNAIAASQTTDATTLASVKSELETLLANPAQNGLSDATSAKLQLLATAVGVVQSNATANSTVLTGIAAEGKPVVPVAPTPPAAPPTT